MGLNYRLEKNIRDYTEIRTSFDALAQRVFGLSFEQWYRDGYWTDRYKPYVLLDGGTVVASIAVNRMQTMWRGKENIFKGSRLMFPRLSHA